MDEVDVIVVGAGPGGASAALTLARHGARVVLLEKRPIPRPKVCAGCLSTRIERLLDPSFHSVVERTVLGVRFTYRGRAETRRRSSEPLAYLVMRERFDAHLVALAREAGAEVRAAEPALDVREHDDGVEATTPRGQIRARYLIGADGATGVVARLLGLRERRRIAVAFEGELPAPERAIDAAGGDEISIDWGTVPTGYGWIFPKARLFSTGVAGLKRHLIHPRPYYEALIDRSPALSRLPDRDRSKGYLIPHFSGRLEPVTSARSLLVGDAAALVDPLLLEGIYYAVKSGRLAASTLLGALAGRNDTTLYVDHLSSEMVPELRAAWVLAGLLHRMPELGYRILTSRPRFLETYFQILRGDATYVDLLEMVARSALRRGLKLQLGGLTKR